MPIKPIQIILTVAGGALTLNVAAETFDGTKPLLCATVDAVECAAREACAPRSPEVLRFPHFLTFDAAEKRISAVRPDGTRLDAPITTVTPLEDRLVLQGVENSLGWSVSINRTTGHMSVAVAGDQVAFSIFGICTLR